MKPAIYVLTFILVTEVFGLDINAKWKKFKLDWNKSYNNSMLEKQCKDKFINLDKKIETHNKHFAAGKVSFTVAHNEFSDDISERKKFKVKNKKGKREDNFNSIVYLSTGVHVPESFDWRQQGWDVPVRKQGKCGACWAFSITGSIEAQFFRKFNYKIILSPQELIDCSSKYNTNGCDGALPIFGFHYVYDHGVTEESILPYKYVNHEERQFNCPKDILTKRRCNITEVKVIGNNDLHLLREAIVSKGPVSVTLDASLDSFENYQSGLYDGHEMFNGQKTGKKCSSTDINHSVLLIGYGVTQDGRKYWIIKNQWGKYWGENGYMRLLDDGTNICGIIEYALIPNLAT